MTNAVQLVERLAEGDSRAADELTPLVYDELRRIASSYLRRENGAHTLQPTALVHEAYARLVGQVDAAWKGEAHFRALAAQTMRRVLVDHARGKSAVKRDGGQRLTLSHALDEAGSRELDFVALDEALTRLAQVSPRQARVVELRFFADLTVEDCAEALGVSARTVDGDWKVARVWLLRDLSSAD